MRRTAWRKIQVALRRGSVAAIPLALASCAVGPDFLSPELPAGASYLSAPLPLGTASAPVAEGNSQRFVPGSDIPPEWWTLFHNRALNALISDAIAANPSLEVAEASLRVAIANVRAQEGALLPSITANFAPSRNKTSAVLAPVPNSNTTLYSLFTAQAAVTYTPDVFGGIRRSIETLDAQANFQLYQLRAAYLTLVGNVANAAVVEASLREQIGATQEIVRLQTETLRVLRLQSEKGQIAGLDVVAQETAVAQTELTLPPLRKQLAQNRNLIAILAGNFPSAQPREAFRLSELRLPPNLPVSVPSDLVKQRPDIQAAEATLHSASASVGVAIANRLPNVTLSGSYGTTSLKWDQLLMPGSRFFSFAGNVAQTIFDADTLRQKQVAAEATYDNAAAMYRNTVQIAFQNVADALRAIQYDALALAAASRAERSASAYLRITRQKLDLGATNNLSLLSAQQAYQQARIGLIQAQAVRLTDTIALFQALGGGWWNRPDRVALSETAQAVASR